MVSNTVLYFSGLPFPKCCGHLPSYHGYSDTEEYSEVLVSHSWVYTFKQHLKGDVLTW